MKLDRKEFLKTALTMAGFGFAVTRVAACGSDTPGGTGAAGTGGGGNACATTAPNETIGSNHGHVLTVSQADVAAAAAKTYSIQGTSAHDHMVTVSAASFATLKAGGTLNLTSTTVSSHSHTVTIVCA
jgi:hypothetical protein